MFLYNLQNTSFTNIFIVECARLNTIQHSETQCQTTSDVFVMIDNNVQMYSKFQLEFVTNLLLKLQSVDFLGTVTLFANARRGYESDQLSEHPEDLRIPLHLLAYNTTSVQLATCRLAWYTYSKVHFATFNTK